MSILSELRFTIPEGFTFGEMINSRGQRLRTGKIETPKAHGTILLLTGLSEFTEKYFETIRDLMMRGFSVHTFDWISQGGSERTLKDEPYKIHVTDFDHYLNDLNQYIHEHLSNTDFYVMGHSMGGHLAMRHVTETAPNPHLLGAFLSAPMFSIKILPRVIRNTLKWPSIRGRFERNTTSYTYGTVDWAPDTYRDDPPGQSPFSSDPIRDRLQREFLLAHEHLRTGGQTNGWLLAAIDSIDALEKNLKERGLHTPTVVCLPSADMIVNSIETREVLSALPSAPLHVVDLNGAKHEVLVELDKYRNAFLQNFDQFLANRPQFSL